VEKVSDLRSLMTKSDAKKDQRKETISGIPEKIYIYRSWFDEDLKRHTIEEEYELKDYIETGAEIVIRYQLRRSQETLHLGGK
jgi:hypothetical protein